MPVVAAYKNGYFNWVNLSTAKLPAAQKFYEGLFGWSGEIAEGSRGSRYGAFFLDDREVTAFSPLDPETQKLGVPSHWLCSIAVDDCDATCDAIEDHGGTVVAGPFEPNELGRMAICADPSGAHFSIWQAGEHPGAEVINDIGTMAWHELMTTDVAKSKPFFEAVFGWTGTLQPFGNLEYTVFYMDGVAVAGMTPMAADFHNLPSLWMVYFKVTDCREASARVEQLGGKILKNPGEIPGLGLFSVAEDSQGTLFGLISFL